jgi:sporulation protein YlmC with PRC-barrel domain
MAEMTLKIGSDVSCTDGAGGEVRRVVVDPAARKVTHLMVEPKGRQGLGRFVPLDLVDATTGEIRLRCTMAEFEKLGSGEETEFVPGSLGYNKGGPAQVISDPDYPGAGDPVVDGNTVPGFSETETVDILPEGKVEVRRGDHVRATDGDIGQIHALRIDRDSYDVTSVLLQEGHHLWGHKEVAIPISAVAGLGDGIRLNLTKQQVEDLPPVDTHHPNL